MASGISCCYHLGMALLLFVAFFLSKGDSLDLSNKQASQSSTALSAGSAIDGDLTTISHTAYDTTEHKRNPWWRVDLEASYCLTRISIVNRMGTYDNRLAGAVVRAGLSPTRLDNSMIGSPVTYNDADDSSGMKILNFISDPFITARYLSVDLPGNNKLLHMTEVFVEEYIDEVAATSTAISLSGSSSNQSSTYNNWVASRAVDGAFEYVSPHCSRTDEEENPWWRIDLMSDRCVGKITIKSTDATYTSWRLRFEGAVIRAGLSSEPTDNMMCGSPVTSYQAVTNNWMEFACNPPHGVVTRYVSVDIPRRTYLTLCEVLVSPCDLPEVDFTVVSPALISQSEDNAVISAYKGPNDIAFSVSFGRQLTTGGSNTGLPAGSSEDVDTSLGCAARLLQLPSQGGIDRTGVFYFEAAKYGTTTKIQTIILPDDDITAQIRPIQRTQVANIGETVILEMRSEDSSNINYRWRHNGGVIISSWDGMLVVSIRNVTLADEGVYVCFVSNQEDQEHLGITRLIVRICSSGMWGPPLCMNTCRRCFNGGVCNDKTGTCICAPGFSGKHCEQVHGRNVFGQNAGHRCSTNADGPHDSACQGRLFCLPDPYGCSCAAGYTALDCMGECDEGMYGADCRQTCHCAAGEMCSKDTGECSGGACDSSYFGNNCQCLVPEDSPVGVISTSVMQRNMSLFWSKPSCGLQDGTITGYTYKLTHVGSGTETQSSITSENSVTINGLIPYAEYSFQVAATTSEGDWSYSVGITIQTEEAEPTIPLNVNIQNVNESSITIEWTKPNPPHGNITNYDIAYWRNGDEALPTDIPNVGTTNLLYQIIDLMVNVTYYIQVRAETKVGEGPWSAIVTETTIGAPGPIQNLRLTNRTDVSLIFDWDPPINLNGPIPRYVVEYRALEKPHQPDFTAQDSYIEEEVESAPFAQYELEPGTKYEFRVSARNRRFTGTPTVLEVYTETLKDPPTPNLPKIYEDKTTDSTVTIGLATALPGNDEFIASYVVQVKKTSSSSVTKREALIPNHYEDSADDYIAAELLKRDVPEIFVVGDKTIYLGYYNAPLQTGTDYEIRVGSVSKGNGTEASVTFSEPITVTVSAQSGNSTAVGVGLAVAALVVIIALIVIFVMYKRRANGPKDVSNDRQPKDIPLKQSIGNFASDHEQGTSSTAKDLGELDASTPTPSPAQTPTPSPAQTPHPEPPSRTTVAFKQPQPVRISELAGYIQTKESAGKNGFQADYETLPGGQLHPWTVAKKQENKQKNRFANVIAYDHSRVVLTQVENDPHSDYINACYIDGLDETDKFIASQGPNKASLKDMWRMVWQLNVDKIVMLTNPVENAKVKCLQYWPDTVTTNYSDISVTIVNEQVYLDHTIRIFKVTQIDTEEGYRLVKQFHYTTWPDMKPPEYPAPVLNFMRVVNAFRNEGRTIIHCSAGVGRTGTYITLDSMLEQMNREGQVDVLGFIYRMRQKRIMMVQTAEQYKFIFQALLAASLTGNTTYDMTDFRRQLSALKQMANGSQETGMEKQFKTLRKLRMSRASESSKSGKLPENVDKNRFPDFIPTDRARPYLTTKVLEEDTNYINANFLPGYRKKDRYIATQMPMSNTVADMWRLVYDQKATCIIMLNPLDEDDQNMCRYWPETGVEQFGPLVVELLQTTKYKGIIGHTFTLKKNKEQTEPARTICLFQYQDWPSEQELPHSWEGMLTLMELTQKWHEEMRPIVVHCIDGLGRTAVYCTLMSLLEQYQEEKVIDVFQAVLRLRIVNRNMMYSLDHYAMCYDVFMAHTDSSSAIYENL